MKKRLPGNKVERLNHRRMLTAVVDAAPVALCVIDGDGVIVLAEGRTFPGIGMRPDAIKGLAISQLWAGQDKILDSAATARGGAAATTTVVADGCAYELRFLPISEKKGPVRHVILVATDVTAQYASMVNIANREEFLQNIIDTVVDGIITIDELGLIRDTNPAAAEIFGYKPNEIVGKKVNMLMPEPYSADHDGYIRDYLETGKGWVVGRRREMVGWRKTGEVFPIEVSVSALEVGEHRHFTGVVRDISERVAAEKALRDSEQRYALAARGANDGLWDWDLDADTIYYSSRWKEMLGYGESEIGDSPDEWLDRIHLEDVAQFRADVEAHLAGRTATFHSEYRMRRKTGEVLRMLARGVAVRGDDGSASRMAGSQSDITERKQAEERLIHDALHDALTGFANRTLLTERIGQALARYKRNPQLRFAVAGLNIDRFRVVNESLGHGAGDDMLVALSRRLANRMRPGDTLGRIGADSFAVLMEDTPTPEDARANVEKLQKVIAQPFVMDGQKVFTTASAGVVMGETDYQDGGDILRNVELAMSSAKREGASQFRFFHENLHHEAVGIMRVETDLRQAIERGGVEAFFQPIIKLSTGRIVGFEALARLRDPERGIIPPAEFIGIAEETGLIIPVCQQILGRACAQTAEWQKLFDRAGKLSVSVNLSARNLADEGLFAMVEQILADTGLEPGNLKMEITESLMMSNPELMTRTLKRIRTLGVGLALDDFGTGYSSLSHLRRFPLNTLKIDRSFVQRMASEARDQELVSIIVQLAHHMGLDVVAEGVETLEHAKALNDLKCEYGQGFYYSAPVPAEEAEAMLLAEQES